MSVDYHTLTQQQRNKKRQRASPRQLDALLRAYSRNSRPDCCEREAIGRQIDMTPRSVQIWFQNMRAKQRLNEKYRGMNGPDDDFSGLTNHCSASRSRVWLNYSTPPTPLSPKYSGFHNVAGSDRYESSTAGMIIVPPPLAVAADGKVRIACESLRIGSWVCNNSYYRPATDSFSASDSNGSLWAYVDTVRIVLSFVALKSTKLYGVDVDLAAMPTASSSTSTEEARNARLMLSISDPISCLRFRTKEISEQVWQSCPNFTGLPLEECKTTQISGDTSQILAAQTLIDSVISQQHQRQSNCAAAGATSAFAAAHTDNNSDFISEAGQEDIRPVPYELDNDISRWLLNLDTTSTDIEVFSGENMSTSAMQEQQQPDSSLNADKLVECRDKADRVTSRLSQQLKAGLKFSFDDEFENCDTNTGDQAGLVPELQAAPELDFMEGTCDELAQLQSTLEYDYVSSMVGDDSSSFYGSVTSDCATPAHYLSRSESVIGLARDRVPGNLSFASVPRSFNQYGRHQLASPGPSVATMNEGLMRHLGPHEIGLGSPFMADDRAFSSANESSPAFNRLNWDFPNNEHEYYTNPEPNASEDAPDSVFDMLLCDEALDS